MSLLSLTVCQNLTEETCKWSMTTIAINLHLIFVTSFFAYRAKPYGIRHCGATSLFLPIFSTTAKHLIYHIAQLHAIDSKVKSILSCFFIIAEKSEKKYRKIKKQKDKSI